MRSYNNDLNSLQAKLTSYGRDDLDIVHLDTLQVRLVLDASRKITLCPVSDTPHYEYIMGRKQRYLDYITLMGANRAQSLESMDYLINNEQEYLEPPHQNKIIICDKNDLSIRDGVHRASRLLSLGAIYVIVSLVG